MATILIVEDEKSIIDMMAFNLKREGYTVITAMDGPAGLHAALTEKPDLVLLDVMLPGMDGFGVLHGIREQSQVPVIMVTAREEERDKIMGLENGADDYVTKPFSIKELSARIKANMRRTGAARQQPAEPAGEGFGPYRLDRQLQALIAGDKVLDLTQREFDIISYFLTTPQRVVSREELMEKVWGYDYYGDLRAVDVAMRRLREKVEQDPAEPKYLLTKRGAGYYLQK